MASHIPASLDTRLTRGDLAKALTEAGFPITAGTLATRASRPGLTGGPPYRVFTGRALYRWGDALEWAHSVTSAPRRCTSERDTKQAA